MKFSKFLLIGLTALLVACGHGYEGEYSEQSGSSNEFLDTVAKIAGERTIVIGPDYIDSNGIRTQFEGIFVRDSGNQKYLVFKKKDGSEEAWKIVDQDTLLQGSGLFSTTLKRIKQP